MSAESILASIKSSTVSMPPAMVAELVAQGATPEQMRAAWAEYKAGYEEGAKEARAASRQRCKAILDHPEAKDRRALALHLTFDTELDADSAARVLAASPKEAAAATGARLNRLDRAIAASGGSPNVGSEFLPEETGESAAAVAKRITSY